MRAGRLPQIGRNVLTAIYAFDPGSPAALDIGRTVAQMHAQQWPIRFGLLPVVPALAAQAAGSSGSAGPSPSETVGRLLTIVSESFGAGWAARFLGEVRQQIDPAVDHSAQFEEQLLLKARQVFLARWKQWAAEARTTPKARAAGRLAPPVALQRALEGVAGGEGVLPFLEGAASLAVSTGIAGGCAGPGWMAHVGGAGGAATPLAFCWCAPLM